MKIGFLWVFLCRSFIPGRCGLSPSPGALQAGRRRHQRHSGVEISGSAHRNTFKTIALENLAASHIFPDSPERYKYQDIFSRRGAGSPDCPLPPQAGSLWYPTRYFQCRAINMLLKNSLDLLFFCASVTL